MKSIESRVLGVIDRLNDEVDYISETYGNSAPVVSKHYRRGLKRAIEIIHITFPDVFVPKEAPDAEQT